MDNILIVSSSNKSRELLINIAKESGSYDIHSTGNSSECKNLIREVIFDLIIINSPLSDDMGENLVMFINEKTDASIILIAKTDYKNIIYDKMEKLGVFIVEKPLNKIIFMKVINLALVYRKKFQNLLEENKKLEIKINEVKLVNRAKLTLMQYLRMSENEAHRYIEKQAMDLRITKFEVAKNILKMYET